MEIEKEKVVTSFNITLEPNEYRLIMDSLSTHIDRLKSDLKEEESSESFRGTEFQEGTITEVKKLINQLESEYNNEWISE